MHQCSKHQLQITKPLTFFTPLIILETIRHHGRPIETGSSKQPLHLGSRLMSTTNAFMNLTVGCRYRWFSPPTLHLISWNKVHNHAKFTYINKFHKFCWIFECRNSMCKNWGNSQAGWPTYPVWSLVSIFCQCVSNHKTKPIQLDCTQDSYPKIERLESRIDGPTCK